MIIIKEVTFFAYFLFWFFMLSRALSLLVKMAFAKLTSISAHRSVRALNSSVESLSEKNISTVKFLFKSVRKSFANVSFPAKNSKRTAKKGGKTSPFDFVQKKFAERSLSFNFSPTIPGGVSPSGTN